MKSVLKLFLLYCIPIFLACKEKKSGSPISETIQNFPSAIVNFSRTPEASVFNGTEEDTWDKNLRERGYILFDEGLYKMWYTGYNESISPKKFLGLAISK